MQSLQLLVKSVGPWRLPVLTFTNADLNVGVPVFGLIGNSVATSNVGAQRTRSWKIAIAKALIAARAAVIWPSHGRFSITIGFSFHVPSHGNRSFDIENFLKPTLDAVAAGLFAPPETQLDTLARWNFDDSRFDHLLIHRLEDASSDSTEGAALFACIDD